MPLIIGLSDAHLTAVGRVAAYWSYVEMTVDVLISSVSKAPDLLTKMIVVGQNFSYRIEVLASVSALIRGKKKRDALQRLLARTRELQAERNFVVHAIWFDSVPSHYGYLLKKNAKGVREET